MQNKETQDYLQLLVKAYDQMRKKVDPKSMSGNRFLHFFHEAIVRCGKDYLADCMIFDFKHSLDPKGLLDKLDPSRRVIDTFFTQKIIPEEEKQLLSSLRVEPIIEDLLDALESSGWSQERIKEYLNNPESHLVQGDPRNELSKEEEMFLFGEDLDDAMAEMHDIKAEITGKNEE